MEKPLTINIPEGFSRFGATEHLETENDMILYFEACLKEDPGDGSLIRAALGDIARARGMIQLARDTVCHVKVCIRHFQLKETRSFPR